MSPRRAKFEIVPKCSLCFVVNRRYGDHLTINTRSPWAIAGAIANVDLLHWHYRLKIERLSDQLPLLFCSCSQPGGP